MEILIRVKGANNSDVPHFPRDDQCGEFFSASPTGHRRLVTPNGGDCKGIPPNNALNSGLGIIVIWLDVW